MFTAAHIKKMLESGDREWLVRSLIVLYDHQTAAEREAGHTGEYNKVGFNKFDAEILTSFAKQWKLKEWLSHKQYNLLIKKLPKYSHQLERIMNEEFKKASSIIEHTGPFAEPLPYLSLLPVEEIPMSDEDGEAVFMCDISYELSECIIIDDYYVLPNGLRIEVGRFVSAYFDHEMVGLSARTSDGKVIFLAND